MANASPLEAFRGHKGAITGVALSPDGSRVFSTSDDGSLHLWDAKTGQLIRPFRGHQGAVYCVVVSADGNHVVTGGKDGTVRLWEVATGKQVLTGTGHKGAVWKLCWAGDQRLLSAGEDGTVRLWDAATLQERGQYAEHKRPLRMVTATADGQQALSGGPGTPLHLWEVGPMRTLGVFPAIQPSGERDIDAALTPNGAIAVRTAIAGLSVWSATNRKLLRPLPGHLSWATTVAVLPDNRRVLSGGWDTSVRLWDVESGKELRTYLGHVERVQAVAASADGRWAVSGSRDRTVRLWELPP
jgi:WD40 repeat protein